MSEIQPDQKDRSSDQQRILITGVSGLVGRMLFNHLTKTYSNEYDVLGLDQHMNISPRYQSTNHDQHQVETKYPLPLDKVFQCDITDRAKLHQIVHEQKVVVIIHLAAVLETDPDLEKMSRVNIQGTKNVFEARMLSSFQFENNSCLVLANVRRIIYASSVMTVFAYLTRQPYCSIVDGTFDDATMLKTLEKVNVREHPPLPDLRTPGTKAYTESKIIGEQMAADIVKSTSKSIICARLGGIFVDDKPATGWRRCSWCSHRDVCLFIDKALRAPLNISGTYFVLSDNYHRWVDLEDAERDLGFVPQDGAEKE